MNKTHMVILSSGMGGSLALTMIMGHLLGLKPDVRATGPVQDGFVSRFMPFLKTRPSIVIKARKDAHGKPLGDVELTAKIHPKPDSDLDEMLASMGNYLWNVKLKQGTVRGVIVRWRDPETGESQRMRIQRPGSRRTLRLYGASSGARRTTGRRSSRRK